MNHIINQFLTGNSPLRNRRVPANLQASNTFSKDEVSDQYYPLPRSNIQGPNLYNRSNKILQYPSIYNETYEASPIMSPNKERRNPEPFEKCYNSPLAYKINANNLKQSKNYFKQNISKVSDSLNDNIETTKLEIMNQLKKVNKGQKNYDGVNKEILDLRTFIKKVNEETQRKHEFHIKNIVEDFKSVRSDLKTRVTLDNKEEISKLVQDIKSFNEVLHRKIDEIEKKQKDQLEQVNYLISHTEPNVSTIDSENSQRRQIRMTKLTVDQVSKEMGSKVHRTFKHMESLKRNKQVMIQMKKTKEINELMKSEVDEEVEDLRKIKDRKVTHLVDRVKQLRRKTSKIAMGTIKNKLFERKFENDDDKIKPINKFRSIVLFVQAVHRFRKFQIESHSQIKVASLKYFVDFYPKVNNLLQEWIKKSTSNTLNSIKRFDKLNLDITQMKSSSSTELRDRFVKLQTRFKGLIDSFSEHTTLEKIGHNTLAFLKILITNGSFIPFKFFTHFEISRIQTLDGTIVGLNHDNKSMVICVYMIVKLFIKEILIDKELNNKNIQTTKNFKIIASILYHTIIDYFKDKCPVINKRSIHLLAKKQNNFDYNYTADKKNDHVLSNSQADFYYRNALKSYLDKKKIEESEDPHTNEKELLRTVKQDIRGFAQDEDRDGIEMISKQLYSSSSIAMFKQLAKEANFDLMSLILNWTKSVINLIEFCE